MKRFILAVCIMFSALSCSKGGDTPKEEENVAPTAACLVFPLNNSECIEGVVKSKTKSTVNFKWEASLHTDAYELKLKNLSTGSSMGYNTSKNELPIELERGVAYSWFIISKNSVSGEITESDTWKFYNASESASSYAPFPAEVVAPEINVELPYSESGITLEWSASDVDNDISAFDIYFGVSKTPELYKENITLSKLENVAVQKETTYYWKVTTVDSQGNTSTSDLFQFKVK
ncbi:fibronectin type III domain-containing protein [Arenibacter amylolyticus]|uniref:hypothetical protein n=1 Tax=Arenibacter amylolyticus TaxID=1406873 RepID=UPI000A3675FF|nr:hypothetical protein [Arenibacter amylolyticus]